VEGFNRDIVHPYQLPGWIKCKKLQAWKIKDVKRYFILLRNIPCLGNFGVVQFYPFIKGLDIELKKSILDFAETMDKHKINILFFNPYLFQEITQLKLHVFFTNLLKNSKYEVKKLKADGFYSYTYLIDLKQSLSDIFIGFNAKTRNQIRRATKENVEIVINDESLLGQFYDTYEHVTKDQKLSKLSYEFIECLFKSIILNGDGLFLASKLPNGVVPNFFLGISTKEVLMYLLGANKRVKGIPGSERVSMFKAIEITKSKVCKYFDMGEQQFPQKVKKLLLSISLRNILALIL